MRCVDTLVSRTSTYSVFLEQYIVSDSNLAHFSIPWISNVSVIRIKKEKDSYETGLSSLGILGVRTVPGYSSLASEVIMGCSSKETKGDTFGPRFRGGER